MAGYALFLCFFVGAGRAALSLDALIPEAEVYLKEELARWGAPGVAVAIVEGDRVRFINGGVEDVRTHSPVTEQSVFCVMSLTKICTSIVLHQLADEGKVDLDAPVVRYFPWFALSDPALTPLVKVKHLVSHCIGWPHFSGDTLAHMGCSRKDLLKQMQKIPMKYKPGERYGYQNVCVGIAGMLVEELEKKPLDAIMRTRIFEKLEMDTASVGLVQTPLWRRALIWMHLAQPSPGKPISGHKRIKGKAVPCTDPSTPYLFPGTSGLNASSADYSKLIACLANEGTIVFGKHKGEHLISERAWKEISGRQISIKHPRDAAGQFPVQRMRSGTFAYGNGAFISTYGSEGKEVQALWHMGSGSGWRALWFAIPAQRFGFVILSNYGSNSVSLLPETLAYRIVDRYLNIPPYEWGKTRYVSMEKWWHYDSVLEDLWRPQPPYEDKELLGTYKHDFYGALKIVRSKKGGLQCVLERPRRVLPLELLSSNYYRYSHDNLVIDGGDGILGTLSVTGDSKGHVTGVRVSYLNECGTDFRKEKSQSEED